MRAAIVAVLGMGLVLSGCGEATSGGSSAPAGSTGTSASAVSEPARVSTADIGLVKGLRPASLASAEQKVTTEVPVLESAPALTQAMVIVRSQVLRGYAAESQRSGLTFTWTLAASSSDVIGFRLLAAPAGGPETPSSVWFDARTNRVVAAPGLVRPGSWKTFSDQVVNAAKGLDADRVRKALASDMAPRGSGPAIGFTTTGDLAVEFGGGTVSDKPSPVLVVVPGKDVTTMLSQLGTRAREAAAQPAAFDPATVAAKPAPEPDLGPAATATATASGSASPSAKASGQTSAKASDQASPSASASTASSNDDRPTVGVVPDCQQLKCVALTFDDGPAASTPQVVSALVKAKVGATFFVLGDASRGNEDGVLASALAGMDIQSHTWRHDQMSRKADGGAEQARLQAEALEKIVGYRPWLVRPPYGDRSAKVLAALGQQGAGVAIWSVDTLDWKDRNSSLVTSRATAARPGDVVLMHDIHPTTAEAVPGILAGLQRNGFTVVSMPELAPPGSWTPGVAWCSSPQRGSATC